MSVQTRKRIAWMALVFVAVATASHFALSSLGQENGLASVVFACIVGLLSASVGFLVLQLRDVQESSRKMALLAEMNVQVNREILLNEDLEQIYSTILTYLFRIFNEATTGSVLKLGDDGLLTIAASRGFTDTFVADFKLDLDDSFLYQVTRGRIEGARLITSRDFKALETVLKPEDWRYQSVISAPIFVGDRLFGLLNLDSAVARTYNHQDVEIVERFRSQIEVVLLARERYSANIKRYQVDALTGLITRQYFEDQFAITLERAARYKESLVVALFDVDGLKQVNDTHGHLAGDQLIAHIARVLRKSARTSDTMGRLGGDEFVACYPLAKMAAIDRTIQDIRRALSEQPMETGSGARLVPAFSFGLASFPADGTSLEILLDVADQRMYAMKPALR